MTLDRLPTSALKRPRNLYLPPLQDVICAGLRTSMPTSLQKMRTVKPSGGSISPLEQHAEFLLGLIADQPDLTLDEIVAAMRKRRIPGSRSAVWRFFARRNISFKKNSVRGGAEACGRSPRSPALDGGASRPLPEREQERPRLSATRLSLHDIAHDDRFHLVGAKSIAGDCGAIATAPRFGAGTSLRLPPSVPIAVRTGSAKTTECCDVMTKPLEPWTA